MSCSILFAVKRAIESARSEIGKGGYFPMGKLGRSSYNNILRLF